MSNEPQVRNTEDAPEVAQVKTPEQIVAEIAGNSRKPVIGAIVAVIVIGIVLVFVNCAYKKKNEEIAVGYETLDKIILKDSNNPVGGVTSPEKLEKKIADLKALQASGVASDATKDALFYQAKCEFELEKYGEAATNFTSYYTKNPTRTPLADLAKLNAANARINLGTETEVKQALDILENQKCSDVGMQDKLDYQAALCNILLGGETRVKNAETILEGLSKAQEEGTPRMITRSADSLLSLLKRGNPAELKKLGSEFPASMVKVTPPKKDAAKKAAPKKSGNK